MPITVVNLSDGAISTATVDAGIIYSGRNGHLPGAYYHHASSSSCNIQARWYLRGVSPDFPKSDGARLGAIIGGVFLTLLGVIGMVLSVGSLSGPIAAATASFWASMGLGAASFLGGIALAVAPELIRNKEALETVSETGRVAATSITQFKGASPFVVETKDGKPQATLRSDLLDQDGQLKAPLEQPHGEAMSYADFDRMRRDGAIYQIKSRDGHDDMTQALINRSLQSGPYPVPWHGASIDAGKVHQIFLRHPDHPEHTFLLKAGEDEGDDQLYLVRADSDEAREQQSNCYWQLAPSHVHAHNRDLGGFILVDRRYMRALCVKDGQLRQYQSDELHMLLHVDSKGVVRERNGEHAIIEPAYASAIWNLDAAGAINQPYQDLYLSARADGGAEVSVQRHGAAGYVHQWHIVAL